MLPLAALSELPYFALLHLRQGIERVVQSWQHIVADFVLFSRMKHPPSITSVDGYRLLGSAITKFVKMPKGHGFPLQLSLHISS